MPDPYEVTVDDDDDILDMLGVQGDDLVGDDDDGSEDLYDDDDDDDVGGEDLVGADRRLVLRGPLKKRTYGRLKRSARGMVQISSANLRKLHDRACRRKPRVSHTDKMRALARAGKIPQIPMGVPATVIATTVTATIVVVPTVPVRITDFFVDSSIAAACAIISMTMARINLLGNANPIPCTGFDPTAGAQRAPLEVRKVPAGSPISILVNNFSLADVTFRAWFQVIDLSTQVY